MNINHIHLGTKDLKRSIEFYTKYFGFEKKSDHGSGAFIVNNVGFLIAIDPVDEVPTFPSWFHIGLCLNAEAQVIELYKVMKESKVRIARELTNEPGEYASFFVFDPDSYKIEISWHAE